MILGEFNEIKEGDTVRRTGEVLSVPVGDGLLGRVVDPLGEPLDGKGPIEDTEDAAARDKAPAVVERQPVKEPLQTGIKAIDAMIPIGRGQRELIIGDRQTGKTAIAIDTIINRQRDQGRRQSLHLRRDRPEGLDRRRGAPRRSRKPARWRTRSSSPRRPRDEAAPIKYIAPYAGCAMAEHFMYKGKHALIVYDDLSKHAYAYRADVAAAAPPAGPRGLPGRRLLPALPAARAARSSSTTSSAGDR